MTGQPRLGITLPIAEELITSGDFIRDYARQAESVGVESVWVSEHVVIAASYEPLYPFAADGLMPVDPSVIVQPDPLDLLSFVAAATTKLKLGTAMMVAPLHSPAVLAKRAASVDRLSGGRLLLGLAVGWHREEFWALGRSYERRGAQLEECIQAMRALWSECPASYAGEFVSYDSLYCLPSPSGGKVPIVLGGEGERTLRRVARLADGWFPYGLSPRDFADRAAVLRAELAKAGRSPDEVELTAWPGSYDPDGDLDAALVGDYVRAGATRIVVSPAISEAAELSSVIRRLKAYQEDVLQKV